MRRIKIAYLNPDLIIWPFIYPQDRIMEDFPRFTLNFFKLRGVPPDYKVTHGWYDAPRNSFAIVISSESFEDIPQGEIPPVIEVEVEQATFYANGSLVRQ